MDRALKYQFNLNMHDSAVRQNHLELWDDLFKYAKNLNGNWQLSQEIFHKYILPTAEQNPKRFAYWVDNMVKVSGLKLKRQSSFFNTIRVLKRFQSLNARHNIDIRKALTELFSAGLDEPKFAKMALSKINKLSKCSQ